MSTRSSQWQPVTNTRKKSLEKYEIIWKLWGFVLTVRLFAALICVFSRHFSHIDQSYLMQMQLHACYESRFAVPEDRFCGYCIQTFNCS